MDQKKIGKFILEMRKTKGLTQRELAEKIGISDKTISKWECGNSMPDISYLEQLCSALGISVNELLSGEHLSQESYSEKAEENIMALMKENESNRKEGIGTFIFGILFVFASFMLIIFADGANFGTLLYYVDGLTLVVFSLLCIATVLLSGKKTKQEILGLLQKTVIPNAVLVSLFQFVMMMRVLEDPSQIGPYIACCILVILYGVITYLIVTLLAENSKREL